MTGFIEIHTIHRGCSGSGTSLLSISNIVRIKKENDGGCAIITINDDINDGMPSYTVESYEEVKKLIEEAL